MNTNEQAGITYPVNEGRNFDLSADVTVSRACIYPIGPAGRTYQKGRINKHSQKVIQAGEFNGYAKTRRSIIVVSAADRLGVFSA
jgi:hypothetical protein